jgi:hypothetical protein
MKMRRLFFCVALGFVMAVAPRALADDPNRLSQLKISVWPEYDQPTVLVMFDGTLADSANLPREISVLVPSSAMLTVTTFENADGTLAVEQSNKSSNLGDGYNRITYTVKTPKYHVEYYDNSLRGSPDKSMDFAFKATAPADQVTIEYQQPLKATNFSVNPPVSSTRIENGFNFFVSQFSNVTSGQALTAQVKYTKIDPNPSASNAPTTTTAAVPDTAPVAASAPGSGNTLLVVVALLSVGVLAVLGFFVLQQRSRQPISPRVSASRKSSRAKGARRSEGKVFCPQCGHVLGPGDSFCSKCGVERRAV